MANLPICTHCKKEIQLRDAFKTYQKKKYHMSCYQELVSEKYEDSHKFIADKKKLITYLCKLFKIDKIDPKISRQIDKIYKDYHICYYDMYRSADYFFRIRHNKPRLEFGIAIVPQVYTEAMKYWKSIERANQLNRQKEITIEEENIRVKQPNYALNNHLIDLDDID